MRKKLTDCDLRHDGDSLPEEWEFLWCGSALNVVQVRDFNSSEA